MKKIKMTDRTIVLKAQSKDTALSFKEKVEIARLLESAQVDVIEFPKMENEKIDTLLLKTTCAFLKNSIMSVDAGASTDSVEKTFYAIQNAKHPRLRIELPMSPVQMEYMYHKKAPKMLELLGALIAKASTFTKDVEFVALDATRAEQEVLEDAIRIAIESGATTITVCDSEGKMLPNAFIDFIHRLQTNVPALQTVAFGVLCNDANGCAVASSMMSLLEGASEIKCTAGNFAIPSICTIADMLRNNGEQMGLYASLEYTKFKRLMSQVAKLTDNVSLTESSARENIPEAEFSLTKNDDAATVDAAVQKLGYDLSEEDSKKVYEAFLLLAEKKAVSNKELDAIVATNALQVSPTYQIVNYVINTGNVISSSAQITLQKDAENKTSIAVGDGPIDAAFKAIDQMIGHKFELDDFQIQAITEGKEAMGSALIRLRSKGKLYSGKGISTDIIGSSIMAYVNAINKIVFEEN